MTTSNPVHGTCAPTLTTERLILRAFCLDDAKDAQLLAGDRKVAAMTERIPHPNPDGAAESWISGHGEQFASGKGAVWAITRRDVGGMIGAIELGIVAEHERGTLGYWVGVPYWGQGYMTEAAQRVLQYAFEERHLVNVVAQSFHTNPASGRVLEKIGMSREGVLRQHFKKWGEFVDFVCYGILREEYEARCKR